MTRTRPWRWLFLHFSHIGLTDGRTFLVPFGFLSRRGRSGGRAGRRYEAPGAVVHAWASRPRARQRRIAMAAGGPGPMSGRCLGGRMVPRGEDSGALGGHRDGELEVRGEGAVLRV